MSRCPSFECATANPAFESTATEAMVRKDGISDRPTIGLVGVGKWGRLLSRVLDRHGDLVAVTGNGAPRGRDWAARSMPHLVYAASVDELLSLPVDAVTIATPRQTHDSITEAALRRGKHVLVEKPLSESAMRSHELHELANRLGLVLTVDYTHVYDSAFRALCERLDEFETLELEWQRPGRPCPYETIYEFSPHVLSMAVAAIPSIQIEAARATVGTSTASIEVRLRGPAATFNASVVVGRVDRLKRIVASTRRSRRRLVWTDMKLVDRTESGDEIVYAARREPLSSVVGSFVEAVVAARKGRSVEPAWPPAVVPSRTPLLLDHLVAVIHEGGGPDQR